MGSLKAELHKWILEVEAEQAAAPGASGIWREELDYLYRVLALLEHSESAPEPVDPNPMLHPHAHFDEQAYLDWHTKGQELLK